MALVDSSGNRSTPGGLYQGQLIFEVREGARGLVLWYGDEAQIPLYGLLGEAAPASAAATPTPRPTLVVSATPRLDVTRGEPLPMPSDTPMLAFTLPAVTPAARSTLVVSATPRLDVTRGEPLPMPSDTPVQALTLPVPTFPPMEITSETVYEVQPGDSLDMIALMFGVTRADLIALNNLTDETELQIGQLLEILRPPLPRSPRPPCLPRPRRRPPAGFSRAT